MRAGTADGTAVSAPGRPDPAARGGPREPVAERTGHAERIRRSGRTARPRVRAAPGVGTGPIEQERAGTGTDMGERQSDGGQAGRRRVHPEGAVPAQDHPAVRTADVESLLAVALIRGGVDAGAEQQAVAAFVAARESGAHGARTRRRDDWRSRRRRFGSNSLKATLSALVAGLTLSGVAVAGIGVAGSSTDEPPADVKDTHAPSGATAPAAPKSAVPDAGSGARDADRPGTAGDTAAHCRAYARVEGRGRALDAPVWKQLVEAAGGAARVDAYCAEQDGARPEGTGRPEGPGPDTPGNGSPDIPDDAARRNPGNAPDTGTDTGTGNVGNGATADDAAGNATGGAAGKPADPGARNR